MYSFSKKNLWLSLILAIHAIVASSSSNNVQQCETCEDINQNFVAGLMRTANANFGGGNTDWEESRLGAFRFSETRLVDIQEKLCSKSRHGKALCHSMAEAHDEVIEKWWFEIYKSAPESADLRQWLCVDKLQLCCPIGRFGKECTECESCGFHGECGGNGTRSGDGTCKCHSGYDGKKCDKCASNYFVSQNSAEEKFGVKLRCAQCSAACANCTGPKSDQCIECAKGFRMTTQEGVCEDVDECKEESSGLSSCKATEFCVNNFGSFDCRACHRSCAGACTGEGDAACNLDHGCAKGYELRSGRCQDIDECATKTPSPCTAAHELCSNTIGSFVCECAPGFKRGGLGGTNQPCVPVASPRKQKNPSDKKKERRKPPALIWTTSFAKEFAKLLLALIVLALSAYFLRGSVIPTSILAVGALAYVMYQSHVLDKTYMRFAPKP